MFKGKNFYGDYCQLESPNLVFNTSESGWVETAQFQEWFYKVFIQHVEKINGPKILVFDGHLSHVSLQVIEQAKACNVHIILLPPHTTHFLQPLDVVFQTVKKEWRKVLQEHLVTSNFADVNKPKFTELFLAETMIQAAVTVIQVAVTARLV